MRVAEVIALKKGQRVRVLTTEKSPHSMWLSVTEGEELTFISMEKEMGRAFCMNTDFTQGNVPFTNLELPTPSSQPPVHVNSSSQRSGRPLLPPLPSLPPPPPLKPLPPLTSRPPLTPRPPLPPPSPLPPMPPLPQRSGTHASPPSEPTHNRDDNREYVRMKVSLEEDVFENPGKGPPRVTPGYAKAPGTSHDPGGYENPNMEIQPYENPWGKGPGSSMPSVYESDELLCVTIGRNAAGPGHLSGNQGDIIKVEKLLAQLARGMIFGESLQTLEKGFISMDILRPVTPLDLKPWYVGSKSRTEAETMLKHPGVPLNTFLVREGQGGLTISMRGANSTHSIRHRLVQKEGSQFFTYPGYIFNNIEGLVEAHSGIPGDENIGQPYNKFHLARPDGKRGGSVSSASSSSDGGSSNKIQTDPDLRRWYIQRSKIKNVEVLGTGNFGEVQKAILTDLKIQVAVKIFESDKMNIADFQNEAVAMKNLRHPNLVKLLGMSDMTSEAESPFIVMELINNGSLKDYCAKNGPHALDPKQKVVIARNVASGMTYLSGQDYIHRDLAARNVLLTKDLSAKIADFGLAKCMKSSYTSVLDGRMPWKWSAPEVIGGRRDWTTKCDVWSYGVFCWELYTNCRQPYEHIKDIQALMKYLETNNRLEIPRETPKYIRTVMEKCWVLNKTERTSFCEIEQILEKRK